MPNDPVAPRRATSAPSAHTAGAAAGIGVVVSFIAFGLATVSQAKLLAARFPGLAVLDLGPRVSTGVLFGVLTSLLLIGLVARGKLTGRMGAVASLATLGWLPVICFGAIVARRVPLVDAVGFVGGARSVSIQAILAGAMLIPLVSVSANIAPWARLPEADRFIRAGAWASLLVIALAACTAVLRSGRPDADGYVASLPVAQSTPEFRLTDGKRFSYRSRYLWPEQVKVRHDERADLWVVEDSWFARFAFLGSDRRARAIHDSDVASFIAPPVGWTSGALVGLVLDGILVGCALRSKRRREQDAEVEGVLQPDGWVALPGMAPMHLPGTARPGPVLLKLRASGAPSYREAGSGLVESWRPGTMQTARDELAGRVTTLYALAMTSGLLCAGPLLLSGLGGSR